MDRQLRTLMNFLAIDWACDELIGDTDNTRKNSGNRINARARLAEKKEDLEFYRKSWIASNRCCGRLKLEQLRDKHRKGINREIVKLVDPTNQYKALWMRRLTILPIFQRYIILKAKARYLAKLRQARR